MSLLSIKYDFIVEEVMIAWLTDSDRVYHNIIQLVLSEFWSTKRWKQLLISVKNSYLRNHYTDALYIKTYLLNECQRVPKTTHFR